MHEYDYVYARTCTRYIVHCTVGEPVFESFSLSVTVGHTCHNKHIWKVSSQNM